MKLPHYFVETNCEAECHHFVCRWLRTNEPDPLGRGYNIVLECHENDALELAGILNSYDPEGEFLDNPI